MSSTDCNSVCKFGKNWCKSETLTHKVEYVWIIDNFDFHEAEGRLLQSPTFSSATNRKVKWYLQINPNGESLEKNSISFDVCVSRESFSNGVRKKIYAKSTASVLDNQQNEIFLMGSRDIDDVAIDEYDFSHRGEYQNWGLTDFLKKFTPNFRTTFLPNNTLTIICKIIFSCARVNLNNIVHSCNTAPLYLNVPECNLVQNFGMLFENHEFADVVLCVKSNEKEYPAHKAILAARSSVFAAMFKHNLKEKETNRIDIEDMSEEVVAELLRYIYTGTCENCEKLADGLLAAADKYDLDRLKMISAEALYKTLSVENAANILALADMHSVTELKSETIKFIVARFAEVVVTTAWKNVLVSSPKLINEVCQAVAGRSPAAKRRRLLDTSTNE